MDFELTVQSAEPVHVQVERFLRRCIHDGKLHPSERLPTTGELVRQWRVDRTAVQKAMAHLAADGLIERRRRSGTFVRAATEKVMIGVLVGPSVEDETACFCRAVLKAIRGELAEMEQHHWTCRVYDGWVDLKARPDFHESPTYLHFMDDLRNHTFKGIIKLYGSLSQDWHDERTEPGADLPTVRLGPPEEPPAAAVVVDTYRLTRESVEFMARRGLKKIVYVRTIDDRFHPHDLDGLADARRALKLPKVEIAQLEHVLVGGAAIEHEAHEKMLRLIAGWQRSGQWPEALLVSDDIAMRGVALALVRKGVDVPGRLLVMTLANEGIVHHYGVPVVRYEFSPRAVARALLDLLWKRIVGEAMPELPVRIGGRIVEPAV